MTESTIHVFPTGSPRADEQVHAFCHHANRCDVAPSIRIWAAISIYHEGVADFRDMKTWNEHLGRSGLRSFTDEEGHFWLEQNRAKASKWAKLARQGHDIAWEFSGPGGAYTGRTLIDGEIYTPSEATKRFLQK